MVTLSQFWMGYTMTRALALADERGVQKPQNIGIYMDDCFCTVQFGLPPVVLASVVPRALPSMTLWLLLMNVHLRRLDNGRVSTIIYWKPTNTNLIIKPQSCQPKKVIEATLRVNFAVPTALLPPLNSLGRKRTTS